MNTGFINKIKRWVGISLFLSFLYQVIFHFSLVNIFACFIICISWIFYNFLSLRYIIFSKFPISSFLIFGFATTQYVLPLVFTSLELKPVTNNLNVPNLVFIHSFLSLGVVLIAQHIYMNLKIKGLENSKITKLLASSGFFKTPKDNQLWVMGVLGLSSMFLIYFLLPSTGQKASGVVQKFVQGFIPFTYAPFFIFLKPNDRNREQNKSFLIKIVFYVILLFIVAIGRNSRGAFMTGFTSLAFYYLLGLILGNFKPTIFTKKNIFLFAIGLYLITGPISDLATAMVVVRGQRSEITRTELLYKTLEVYNDKEKLLERVNNEIDNVGEWDENYLDDRFLSRFSNLKYNDVSLELYEKLGYNSLFLDFQINSSLAVLPQPLIQLFGLNVDKSTVNAMSHGDYLYFLTSSDPNALGGFRVGHFSGTGMVAFGWLYLPFLCALCIPLFYLLDCFVLIYRNKSTHKSESVISYAIIIPITSIFMYFPFESVTTIISYLLRGWLQSVLLYWVVIKITSFKLRV